MNDENNLTAELYTVWLIQTMTQLDDGPEFNHLQNQFNQLLGELEHLENCLALPSHETDRRF